MLIRVRTNVGVWRVDGLNEATATLADLLAKLKESRPQVVFLQMPSLDPAGKQLLVNKRLVDQGLQHGSMVYARVDPETCIDVSTTTTQQPQQPSAATNDEQHQITQTNENQITTANTNTAASKNRNMRRVIDKDGHIKLVPSNEAVTNSQERGFRKGMLPLRDMKMQWTLNDFIALDSQFEFKIQRQESAICQQVSLDVPSTNEFQAYLQKFQFQRKRFGFLYGYFLSSDDNDSSDANNSDKNNNKSDSSKMNKVRVEAIYEPPQQFDPETAEGFVPLEDPKEDVVNEIASLLGLKKVGWIFGHEARDPDLVMSNAEILMAAEYQLEAAGGVNETPFVTVKVCPSSAKDGTVSVEAFQVSQQCMAMVAEEALELDINPKVCKVNETFTAIQEGKPSPTVENSFFLCVAPIVQHTSTLLLSDFPRLNRDVDDRCPSHDELRKSLQKSGSSGWNFEDRLADLNLLVYLSDFLDINADLVQICNALANRQPLDDGYKIILKSMAGMEGSY